MHNSTLAEPSFSLMNPQSGGPTLNVSLVPTNLNEEQRFTYRGLNQNFQKGPASVVQLVEHYPMYQEVTGSGQNMCTVFWLNLQ